ncbi:MAG TPA: malonate decarboxylase subunit alpha [Firmicutes bacterium]|nr:malonate decarboxylase subunit alpha [Bacillota bacterium]
MEGNNQKQASFLSKALSSVNPDKVKDLHLIISSINRPEHLDVITKGIVDKIDFAYAGPQSKRVAQMLKQRKIKIGGVHTYLELYGRLFVDLIPRIALIAADKADIHGNLFTGPNTEETPTLVEATAFSNGIVIAQVNELVEELPRVDIPGSWIDLIVVTDEPYAIEALFTRDPQKITATQILMAMMVIKGVYARHGVVSLNHGVGYNTAAIELLLPTYGESLGLKGKICKHWVVNPHPTLIPAIESGWIESIYSFGGEAGMEKYVASRSDIFFTGHDSSLRSNRTLAQIAGQYAVDLFIGSTLQMDRNANSSAIIDTRWTGFGGAPNMGHNPGGRRHASSAWLDLSYYCEDIKKGRKLVVQVLETFWDGKPNFLEKLDAVKMANEVGLESMPVMIYGNDVTHVVTEQGIAYLYKATSIEERRQALAAVAVGTPIATNQTSQTREELRRKGMVAYPEDLQIDVSDAKRSLLAAQSIEDLVKWSGGLYQPPSKFVSKK